MLRILTASILAFIIFLFLHVMDFYFLIPTAKVNHLLATALIGLGCFIILLWILPTEDWFQRIYHMNETKTRLWVFPLVGALFYGFLFLGYLEFYFTADRSITFRMLMIIDKEPHHLISRETMFRKYDIPGIINKRFDDLTYGKYIEQEGNQYHLTSKGILTLNIYRLTIDTLHLHSGEKETESK